MRSKLRGKKFYGINSHKGTIKGGHGDELTYRSRRLNFSLDVVLVEEFRVVSIHL